MFNHFMAKIPAAGGRGLRYRRLYALDSFLDGRLYDFLRHSFFEEADRDGQYVPILDRRPSTQLNWPRHFAQAISRKLFAGRHAPRLIIAGAQRQDAAAQRTLEGLGQIVREVRLGTRMLQASMWGSVGAVAITFRIERGTQFRLKLWRARFCWPTFDENGRLNRLRIAYLSPAAEFLALGRNHDAERKEIKPDDGEYWFVRDYGDLAEQDYLPIKGEDWQPDGGDNMLLKADPERETKHGLGLVPAHWMVNLEGGGLPDGVCWWESSASTWIDQDYTLSQTSRGSRYSAAPELVLKGSLINQSFDVLQGKIARGGVLQFATETKDYTGQTTGGGDAKLLELTGGGLRASVAVAQLQRKLSLETVSASRRDPDKLNAMMSGLAMMLVDEDYVDLVQSQHGVFGDDGLVPLLHKMALAAKKKRHRAAKLIDLSRMEKLRAVWPRVYEPTMNDLQQLQQAAHGFLEDKVMDKDEVRRMLMQLDVLLTDDLNFGPQIGAAVAPSAIETERLPMVGEEVPADALSAEEKGEAAREAMEGDPENYNKRGLPGDFTPASSGAPGQLRPPRLP